jgi:hypothetical protein
MKPDEINFEDITLLWSVNWYDGMLSAIGEYKGQKCFLKCVKDEFEADHRVYLVYRLTDAEFAEEEKWHKLFRENVGTHTEYIDGKREGKVAPQKLWDNFMSRTISQNINFANIRIVK